MALLITEVAVHVAELDDDTVVLVRLDLRVQLRLRVDVDLRQGSQLVDLVALADHDAADAGDALELRLGVRLVVLDARAAMTNNKAIAPFRAVNDERGGVWRNHLAQEGHQLHGRLRLSRRSYDRRPMFGSVSQP